MWHCDLDKDYECSREWGGTSVEKVLPTSMKIDLDSQNLFKSQLVKAATRIAALQRQKQRLYGAS